MKQAQLQQVIKQLKGFLETEKYFGIKEYISDGNYKKVTKMSKDKNNSSQHKEKSLDEIRKRVSSCKKCSLYKERKNTVFGKGDINARLLFIGEAPGKEEDLMGEPFVGRAGILLTKIINSIGFERKDIYIANCIKCRPPLNRPPTEDELRQCEEYLIEQIKIINPKLICTLGKYATLNLLKIEEPISSLRGNFYEYLGIKVIPTFHPAYLLRNPKDKALVWEDMKKIRSFLKNENI